MAMWKSGIILRIFGIGLKRTSDDGWHHSTFESVKPEQLTAKNFMLKCDLEDTERISFDWKISLPLYSHI